MKLEDIMTPLQELPTAEQLDLIAHVRSQRHFAKPAKIEREKRSTETKAQKMLKKLSPEDRQALLQKLQERLDNDEA